MPAPSLPEPLSIGRVVVYRRPVTSAKTQLVVLHGALGSAGELASLQDLLPDQDLLFVDFPGHGHAPYSPGGYGAEALAVALQAALEKCCDARPIALLAESFSGLAALHLASSMKLIAHVVLIDTPLDTTRMLYSQKMLTLKWLKEEEKRDMLAELGRDFFGLNVEKNEFVARTYHHYLFRCPAPITMITGVVKSETEFGAGAFFNQQDLDVLRSHPRLGIAQVPNVGHRVFRMQPAAVRELIQRILAGIA